MAPPQAGFEDAQEVDGSSSDATAKGGLKATAVPSTPGNLEDSRSAPVNGLRYFAREGVDGVFMGAAGVPLRYRL